MTTSPRPPAAARVSPWAELRSVAYRTFLYQKMVGQASSDAEPGSCVSVYDRRGELFGHGLFNPRSEIALRMLNFDATPIDEAFWQSAVGRAVQLRTRTLRLQECTDACRLIHAEGDDLSGLIVDRYGDVLSLEIFSLGMWRLLPELLPILHAAAGTKLHIVRVDEKVQQQEGFSAEPIRSEGLPASVKLAEHGVRFQIDFEQGHKTGFFCDQRENRLQLARMTGDADVLDLCCYTGGFGLYAKVLGKAREVTCVDLDERAIALAKRNANLNQVRLDTAQADAFTYMRQMQSNERTYDVVVLDPPKLIPSRQEMEEGLRKYADLNRLAASLVKPDGLLLTCSCSGALQRADFVELVLRATRQAGRESQILNITGAGPDHPVSPRCPESGYLKAVWLRLR